MKCIFGSPDQWASNHLIDPDLTEKMIKIEAEKGVTINRSGTPLDEVIAKGTPYKMDLAVIAHGLSKDFNEDIILKDGEWTLPSGAFGEYSELL